MIFMLNFHTFLHTIYQVCAKFYVKISLLFAEYFDY